MAIKKGYVCLLVVAVLAVAVAVVAEEQKGAADMVLFGGKSGDVPFPHLRHQDTLKDCKTCHDMFPQEPGVIEKLKAGGELKSKAVMNAKCTKCHRLLKKEGKPTGPTSCKKCHAIKG